MTFYVFDLDGTLADCSHRLHFINGETKDWRGFFAAVEGDQPIDHVLDTLCHLERSRENRIEIWSGRSDECRPQTESWLNRNGIQRSYLTHMRKAGDHRPDDVVKLEFLRDCDACPDIIFDDRDRVVQMWRREGLTCFQVANGAF
jgi:hypothetical protein